MSLETELKRFVQDLSAENPFAGLPDHLRQYVTQTIAILEELLGRKANPRPLIAFVELVILRARERDMNDVALIPLLTAHFKESPIPDKNILEIRQVTISGKTSDAIAEILEKVRRTLIAIATDRCAIQTYREHFGHATREELEARGRLRPRHVSEDEVQEWEPFVQDQGALLTRESDWPLRGRLTEDKDFVEKTNKNTMEPCSESPLTATAASAG